MRDEQVTYNLDDHPDDCHSLGVARFDDESNPNWTQEYLTCENFNPRISNMIIDTCRMHGLKGFLGALSQSQDMKVKNLAIDRVAFFGDLRTIHEATRWSYGLLSGQGGSDALERDFQKRVQNLRALIWGVGHLASEWGIPGRFGTRMLIRLFEGWKKRSLGHEVGIDPMLRQFWMGVENKRCLG